MQHYTINVTLANNGMEMFINNKENSINLCCLELRN